MAQPSLVDIRESFRSDRAEIVAGLRSRQASQGAADHELLRWVVKCDNAEIWREDGTKSTGQWLAQQLGISHWKACRMIAAGRALESLPYTSSCLANGSLSLDKVLELTRFATPETERGLVRWARRATPGGIRERADKLVAKKIEEVKDVFSSRSLSWMHTLDGHTLCLEAMLPADQGAVLCAAIDRIADTLPDMPVDEERLPVEREYTVYQRRADALVSLATARLAEDHDPDIATVVVHAPLDALMTARRSRGTEEGANGHRGNMTTADIDSLESGLNGEVDDHITHDSYLGSLGGSRLSVVCQSSATNGFVGDNFVGLHAELDLGPNLHALTAERLACDCRLEVASVDGSGRTVGVGRATRIVPRWLRRQLMRRDDHTCRFPGCGAKKFLHAHHIIHWAHDGPTNLDNLLSLCSTHHTLVHEFGWSVSMSSSGVVTWFRPGGRIYEPGLALPPQEEIDRAALPDPPRPIEARRYSRLLGIAALF